MSTTARTPTTVLEFATSYAAAGISVFAVRADGTKSPCASWTEWQSRIASRAELAQMFARERGIACVAGRVSGNREVLDVDAAELVGPFERAVHDLAPDLLEKLPTIATPRSNHGGRHYHYRLADPPAGNTKLALSELRPKWNEDGTPELDPRTNKQRLAPETLIETRGEGGYVLMPGSPAKCHAAGLPYLHFAGPPVANAPIISADEHAVLWRVARSLNRLVQDESPTAAASGNNGDAPGDAFENAATWEQILEPHGWAKAHVSGEITHWRRPGKSRGWSATTGCKSQAGRDLFCVFSSNAFPFEGATGTRPCTAYGKFAAYAVLNHNADFSAAARALSAEGYGAVRQNGQRQNANRVQERGGDQQGASPIAPVVVALSDVKSEPVSWLWERRIALGKVTLIAGDPGLGKSFLSLDIAARVSNGALAPEGDCRFSQGSVILLSAEDDLGDTIKPRLLAAGADLTKIVAMQAIRGQDGNGQYDRPVDLARDLPVVETVITRVGDCRLVVIDPLSCYLGSIDSHNNAEVRQLMAPLAELASRAGIAILGVTHLRKSSDGPAVYRAMGSLAFAAAARAVWGVTRDKDDPEGKRRLFLPVKNNLGPDQTGLSFVLTGRHTDGTPCVLWDEGAVTVSADEAFSAQGKGAGRPAEERSEAEQFLREALADGPRPAKDVEDEALNRHCISRRTLERARKTAGVEAFRPKNPGPWLLRLSTPPEHTANPPLSQYYWRSGGLPD